MALQGPSVAFMKGEAGSLISLLARKKPIVGWSYYVFALSSVTKTLFQFRSQLVYMNALKRFGSEGNIGNKNEPHSLFTLQIGTN